VLVLTDTRLIDGTGRDAIDGATVAVEEGKLAGLVAVSGDSLANIGDARNVELVVADGKVVVDRLGHGRRR